MKKEATPKRKWLENKNLRRKKSQPQNARGSKIKTSDKKVATLKCKVLKNKDLRRKRRQPQNAKGSKTKTSNEKKGNPKIQGAQK
jgi:hypothetical protein